MEWGRAASLAVMLGGLLASRDPWEVVPPLYRPKGVAGSAEVAGQGTKPKAEAAPPVMTPEERAYRLELGVLAVGQMLRQSRGKGASAPAPAAGT